MKYSIWLLLFVLLGGPGCLRMPRVVWDDPPKQTAAQTPPPVSAPGLPPPPPPIVSPEELNEANYSQNIDRLRAELDFETTRALPSQPVLHTVDDGYRP
jgi:hypothetical protein